MDGWLIFLILSIATGLKVNADSLNTNNNTLYIPTLNVHSAKSSGESSYEEIPLLKESQVKLAELLENYRFIVAIRTFQNNRLQCYGFLVGPYEVVTTASCVFKFKPKHIYIYQSNVGSNIKGQKVIVKAISIFPDFRPELYEHDLAVLHMPKWAKLGKIFASITEKTPMERETLSTFAPMTIPRALKDDFNFLPGRKDLTVISRSECSMILSAYIPCEEICLSGNELIYKPAYLGTPLIKMDRSSDKPTNVTPLAYGIMSQPSNSFVQAVTFMPLRDYMHWVQMEMSPSTPTEE